MSGILHSNSVRGKSNQRDPRGHHVRIYDGIYNSAAYLALSYSAKALYVEIRCLLRQGNNGNISVTLATLRRRGWPSSATIAKGLRALIAVGLIKKTRQGGITAGGELCCLYAVTDESVSGDPGLGIRPMSATYDYRKFQTVADAKKAIADAPLRGARRKRKVQNLPVVTSESEPKPVRNGSEIPRTPGGTFTNFNSLRDEPPPFT